MSSETYIKIGDESNRKDNKLPKQNFTGDHLLGGAWSVQVESPRDLLDLQILHPCTIQTDSGTPGGVGGKPNNLHFSNPSG